MIRKDRTDNAPEPRSAADWFLAMRAGEDSNPRTLQAWLAWLEEAPENRRAFEELIDLWQKIPAAVVGRSANPGQEDEYDGTVPVAEWLTRASPAARAPARAARWPRFAVAAAVLLAVSVIGIHRFVNPAVITTGQFYTGIGEQKQLPLADGSRITLGAGSKLSVDLTSTTREIRLDAGEAYFAVARDPSRPFIVHALNGAITAVGTSFNVQSLEDRVTVTVTEGRVSVADTLPAQSPNALHPGPTTLVDPGEQVSYSPATRIAQIATTAVTHVDAGESTRWREGWLVYRDEPLRYVIADIRRYTDLNFRLADSAADIRFSGTVHKSKIGEWIVALPEVADVTVKHESNGFDITARVQ